MTFLLTLNSFINCSSVSIVEFSEKKKDILGFLKDYEKIAHKNNRRISHDVFVLISMHNWKT